MGSLVGEGAPVLVGQIVRCEVEAAACRAAARTSKEQDCEAWDFRADVSEKDARRYRSWIFESFARGRR